MAKQKPFDFTVPGEPEQVSARIKAQTRVRLPMNAKPFGSEDKALGGIVQPKSFRVGLNHNDIWTRMQAVASGELEAVPGGTRVHGSAGIPAAVVWLLRLAFIVAVVMVGVAGALVTRDAGLTTGAMVSGLFAVATLASVLSIGWNVNHADAQIPALLNNLQQTASGSGAVSESETSADLEADLQRLRAAATRQQKS